MKPKLSKAALGPWLLVAVYYFYQYALRSAPSVMIPQLTEAFAVTALGVSAIVGMFYYGYSPFSLVAGAAIDRLGARKTLPVGAALVGIDSYNIDDTRERKRPVHTKLLGANIPICEHMTSLGSLPDEGFRFSAVPPKVRGMGTFPVRAYAVVG